MRALGFLVRRLLEVACFLVGGLVLVVVVLLGLHAIARPECSVDPDDARAVLVDRLSVGAWMVLEVGWVVVLGRAYARSPDDWRRLLIAAMVPVGMIVVWIVFGEANQLLLDVVDAGAASASCW